MNFVDSLLTLVFQNKSIQGCVSSSHVEDQITPPFSELWFFVPFKLVFVTDRLSWIEFCYFALTKAVSQIFLLHYDLTVILNYFSFYCPRGLVIHPIRITRPHVYLYFLKRISCNLFACEKQDRFWTGFMTAASMF